MEVLRYRVFSRPNKSRMGGQKWPWMYMSSYSTLLAAKNAVKAFKSDGNRYQWAIKDGPPSDVWLSGKR